MNYTDVGGAQRSTVAGSSVYYSSVYGNGSLPEDAAVIDSFVFDVNGTVERTVYPILREKFDGPLQVVLSSDYWVDVMSAVINKGVAVRNVQRLLGISPDECAAFGDYLNDAEMMQAVTYSFAVENAHPGLKKIARYSTAGNNDAGVLVGIRRLIDEGLI